MMTRVRIIVAAGVLLGAGVGVVLLALPGLRRAEADRLAELLALRDGMTVGEIGAGDGRLTLHMAQRVGPSGRVYSTELGDRLTALREAVGEAGLSNVTVIEAGAEATNLPAGCCDAIVMRRVYHHLSDPAGITASIHQALTPGGLLAIIEFETDGVPGWISRMGVDRADLVDAVGGAGFEVVTVQEWTGWDHYIAVFRKIDKG